MAKRLDPETRRAEIAEAVWRVILRDGLAAASVRGVAEEAGMSAGSLRHFFGTQGELLLFAWQLVIERAMGRVEGILDDRANDPWSAAIELCEQMLPLDEDRRAEMQVWSAFVVAAQTDPALAAVRDESDAMIAGGFRQLVGSLQEAGVFDPALPVEREAARLHALLDGIAAHGVNHPERMNPELQRDILVAHLESLRPR